MSKAKPYIMIAAYDNSKWVIENHTHPPKDRFISEPVYDVDGSIAHPSILEWKHIIGEFGEPITILVISPSLKAEKIAKDKNIAKARKDKKDLDDLTRNDFMKKLRDFNVNSVSTLDDVKIVLNDIVSIMAYQNKKDIDKIKP